MNRYNKPTTVCLKDHIHNADPRKEMRTSPEGQPYYLGSEFDCNQAQPIDTYTGPDRARAQALLDWADIERRVCLSTSHTHQCQDPIGGADYVNCDAYHCVQARPIFVYRGAAREEALALEQLRPARC
jgi:hypothetical protein